MYMLLIVQGNKSDIYQFALFIVGKAFAAATSIVFGGATVLFVYVAYKLELHTVSCHTDF